MVDKVADVIVIIIVRDAFLSPAVIGQDGGQGEAEGNADGGFHDGRSRACRNLY